MEQPIVCATCGIIIHWQPTVVDGLPYCCPGCAQGGPCNCDYDNLPQPGQSSPMVIRTAPDRVSCRFLDDITESALSPRFTETGAGSLGQSYPES